MVERIGGQHGQNLVRQGLRHDRYLPTFAMFRSKFVDNVTISEYILGFAEFHILFIMQI